MKEEGSMIRNFRKLLLPSLASVLVCVGCLRHSHSLQHYDSNGVTFSHYSDWSITKDAPINDSSDFRIINLSGPEHAVISLVLEPTAAPQTLDDFASVVAEKRTEETEKKLSVGSVKLANVDRGTSERTTGTVGGQRLDGVLQRFSVEVMGVQVPHEARFYLLSGVDRKIMIMSQVASAKAVKVREGSDLILNTLAIKEHV